MGANAQTSVPTFTAGDVLTAANMNISAATGVPVFSTTTTRDAAFGGTGEKTLAEGQMCYIEAAPKRFQVYNGTAWLDYDAEWTTFTPTWSNLTVGNGTMTTKYVRLGKLVVVSVNFSLGSTSSIATDPTLTLPFTADGTTITSQVLCNDNGVRYIAATRQPSSTTVAFATSVTNGTFNAIGAMNATQPFTWGTGDDFFTQFTYQAA